MPSSESSPWREGETSADSATANGASDAGRGDLRDRAAPRAATAARTETSAASNSAGCLDRMSRARVQTRVSIGTARRRHAAPGRTGAASSGGNRMGRGDGRIGPIGIAAAAATLLAAGLAAAAAAAAVLTVVMARRVVTPPARREEDVRIIGVDRSRSRGRARRLRRGADARTIRVLVRPRRGACTVRRRHRRR